jgi:hypothetical protein
MKKYLITHFLSVAVFFLLVTLYRRLGIEDSIAFWLGGAVGVVAPDLDFVVRNYFLKYRDLSSQESDFIKRSPLQMWKLFVEQKENYYPDLVFHTARFQVVFAIFSFWVISSTSSVFAFGVVLGVFLHILVDELLDIRSGRGIKAWFGGSGLGLDMRGEKVYILVQSFILFLFGFIF